jgi:hypothetical protein
LECAGGACRGAGRRPHTGGADGQADQCRIPERFFDATGEHHDARTLDGIDIASGRAFDGHLRHGVRTAGGADITGSTGSADRGCRQETAGAKIRPSADTRAGRVFSTRGTSAIRFLGMIPR